MKIAILSDVHGNLVALDAVVADVEQLQPDLIVHGGDLAFNGPRPAECVDRIRELGWPGVIGNMDRALEMYPTAGGIGWARQRIGEERNAWLQDLPMEWRHQDQVAVVHAVPGDLWQAIFPQSRDAELRAVYGPLGARIAVYGHIHRPFVRVIGDLTVANSGSVGLPSDGDPRPSYLIISEGRVEQRRLAYDVERAAAEVLASDLPEAEAVARAYRTGTPPTRRA